MFPDKKYTKTQKKKKDQVPLHFATLQTQAAQIHSNSQEGKANLKVLVWNGFPSAGESLVFAPFSALGRTKDVKGDGQKPQFLFLSCLKPESWISHPGEPWP